ncbi:putative intracellular protein transport protein USO1-like [Heracleum sosnowskyi]|uniref:Intracellular protein transport protein USO1-like n=1 Tax=Heracleum sosnowskyi TaxID=360622 RepID=A0AAD8MHL6_9APIA|nr:putative intracellular protein transport protein USO1-like [Heracleum sosnowskyi]
MSKHRWKDLKKSLWIHINPEKGEELKAVQIEDDDRRGKILKLIKTINQGKKEAISKKKSELLKLFDDIQQQYQFLYALYDNLTSEVRKVVDNKDEDSSESSDSEPFYSPNEFSARNSPMVRRFPINSKLKNDKDQGTEEAYLKDKLTSTSEVVKEAIDATQELGKTTVSPETMDESSLLKVKLFKSKEKIQSMTNVYDVYKMETAARIKELEGQVFMLKLELDTMETEKTKLEEQLQTLQENNSQIENQNFDFEKHSVGETEKSLEASDLQSEVNSLASQTVVLKRSSSKAECFQTLIDDKDSDMQVKDSEAKKQLFEQQIRTMINDANESREAKEKFHEKIVELEKRSREREYELSTQLKTSETRRNSMSEEIVSLTSQLNSLQQEVKCLQVEKSDLFLQIDKAEEESEKLSTLRNQNSRLTEEVEDQQKTLIERQVIIDKYNEEHKHYAGKDINVKSYVQQVEKKIEEAAEGLRKQLEDNLRILSRRIRVAEQLHLENKDLYSTTKEKYEQDSKDLETLLHMLKDFSLSANSMLNVLDTAVLRFEELNDHFMNRISQVTGALIFAKDWMNRKNNTITHMKDDLDTVLKQLDDKESEILGLREKVRKLENKVRKADKLLKQKEEGMLSLGEEKREAIRQLCVWMDYHRSHSEHLKKMIRSLRAP